MIKKILKGTLVLGTLCCSFSSLPTTKMTQNEKEFNLLLSNNANETIFSNESIYSYGKQNSSDFRSYGSCKKYVSAGNFLTTRIDYQSRTYVLLDEGLFTVKKNNGKENYLGIYLCETPFLSDSKPMGMSQGAGNSYFGYSYSTTHKTSFGDALTFTESAEEEAFGNKAKVSIYQSIAATSTWGTANNIDVSFNYDVITENSNIQYGAKISFYSYSLVLKGLIEKNGKYSTEYHLLEVYGSIKEIRAQGGN